MLKGKESLYFSKNKQLLKVGNKYFWYKINVFDSDLVCTNAINNYLRLTIRVVFVGNL